MIAQAIGIAESWDERLSALVPHDGRPLRHEEEQFLFRVHARLTQWLRQLESTEQPADGESAIEHRAGVRYLEVLRLTVHTTLFKANRGLVRKEAWAAYGRARSAGRRLTTMGFDDIQQEGDIGLATAIEQFDGDRGVRFSTFASRVIRRHIDRAIVSKEPLVYLPEHALTAIRTIRQFTLAFRDRHGCLPSREEIVEATGVTMDTLEAIHAVGRRVAEQASDEPEPEPIWERLPDPGAVDALRVLVSAEVQQVVNDAVQTLDELEREVVDCRFGLGGRAELSQADIARRMGLSQQRIVQIEARALLKILIAARLRGVDAPGTTVLRSSLEHLAAYGVDERRGLVMLQNWLSRSDRFRTPGYVRERLAQLEALGLSREEIGEMLDADPKTIGIAAARKWRRRRS